MLRPRSDADFATLGKILCQCFNAPEEFWPRYRERLGDDAFRIARRDDRLVGGLAVISMGQWWGGRSVPMAGIAAVGVAPEARGTGVAAEMMRDTVRDLHADGCPLSTLYSAAQRLYRSVGFEIAGHRNAFEIDARALGPADRELTVREVDLDDPSPLTELDRRRGEREAGPLDRGRAIWHQLAHPTSGRTYAYLVGPDDAPEGYVLFAHAPTKGVWDYDVYVHDLVALTPAAHRRLLTLLADHRSQSGNVRWIGPPADPRLLLFPEPEYRVVETSPWHLRVVDVAAALTGRGWPTGIEEEIHLEFRDDLIPENSGRRVLRIAGGRGAVEEGGRGELRLDVRGLAPLYAGLHSATALAAIGLLEGPPESLRAADGAFAGPDPWMPDSF